MEGPNKPGSTSVHRHRLLCAASHGMDRRWVMSAAAVVLLLALSVGQVEGAAKQQQQQESWSGLYDKLVGRTSTRVSSPDFCVVVRTYWGHGQRAGDGGLRRLLRSLHRQSVHS